MFEYANVHANRLLKLSVEILNVATDVFNFVLSLLGSTFAGTILLASIVYVFSRGLNDKKHNTKDSCSKYFYVLCAAKMHFSQGAIKR